MNGEGLTRQVIAYCERADHTYWSEPVNALTNLAFLLATLILWRRIGAAPLPLARAMVAVLVAVGVGSWLWHTHARAWAGIADVLPILLFILVYLYAANRDYWGLSRWGALALTAAFIPYAAATVPLFRLIPGLGSSAAYGPVPLLILIYAALLARRLPGVARGLAIGAAILVVSLAARTLDGPLCEAIPIGTHFLWHVLNALMLGWMIEVYRRHMLTRAAPA